MRRVAGGGPTIFPKGPPHERDAWHDRGMNQGFGVESPGRHVNSALRQPARYLVLIDSGGSMVARLFLETREPVAEFDAGAEEVAVMTRGLTPVVGVNGPEWDTALEGHSAAERGAAELYTLDI